MVAEGQLSKAVEDPAETPHPKIVTFRTLHLHERLGKLESMGSLMSPSVNFSSKPLNCLNVGVMARGLGSAIYPIACVLFIVVLIKMVEVDRATRFINTWS